MRGRRREGGGRTPPRPRDTRGPDDPFDPFDRLDTLSPDALGRWWVRRLRAVVELARAELPFHRERLDAAGLGAGDVRGLEDLRRLRPFTKADLAEAQRRRGASVGLERGIGAGTVWAASSGTGRTTFVALPPRWRRQQGRSSLRAHWWAGLRPGTPFVVSAPAWHTYAAVQSWWSGRLGLPCAVVAGTYLPRFAPRIVDALVTFRPRFLTLFLPMVFTLAAEARRRGRASRDPFASVETLVVSGAPITPGMRAELERETGVGRVVELAGSSENLLAVECRERSGLHVVPDTCHAEVVDPVSGEPVEPGSRGRVVHSALVPWGSIYLRYDGGDVGVHDPGACPCGLPSPRLKLLGRADEAFTLSGRTFLPYDVQLALEEALPELAGTPFAIVRDALAEGRLELALGAGPQPRARGAEEALAAGLARRLGVPVGVREAPQLPLRFKGVPSLVEGRALG